jgi:hypothetical protein
VDEADGGGFYGLMKARQDADQAAKSDAATALARYSERSLPLLLQKRRQHEHSQCHDAV